MTGQPSAETSARHRMQAFWRQLQARERRLIGLSALVVGLALLWWLGLSPALRTLRTTADQRAELQAKAQQMQQLQREAAALKALPRMGHEEALRTLQATTQQRLGAAAQLSVVGDRANVTLQSAPAAALADWLTDARVNARAMPVDARLTRQSATTPDATILWSGTLSLSLPSP
ncbi:type II secretion system protein GspM [Ottowia sp.]|uniref:type II secretion system protein GspM n=1 Tax=Ottowia sp. TaxID=1898956 RepID=UPI003A874F3F